MCVCVCMCRYMSVLLRISCHLSIPSSLQCRNPLHQCNRILIDFFSSRKAKERKGKKEHSGRERVFSRCCVESAGPWSSTETREVGWYTESQGAFTSSYDPTLCLLSPSSSLIPHPIPPSIHLSSRTSASIFSLSLSISLFLPPLPLYFLYLALHPSILSNPCPKWLGSISQAHSIIISTDIPSLYPRPLTVLSSLLHCTASLI